jgi:hypothetical protein
MWQSVLPFWRLQAVLYSVQDKLIQKMIIWRAAKYWPISTFYMWKLWLERDSRYLEILFATSVWRLKSLGSVKRPGLFPLIFYESTYWWWYSSTHSHPQHWIDVSGYLYSPPGKNTARLSRKARGLQTHSERRYCNANYCSSDRNSLHLVAHRYMLEWYAIRIRNSLWKVITGCAGKSQRANNLTETVTNGHLQPTCEKW